MLQREALEILKTGSNVFLTGVPGAGKTYVINKYVEWLKDKGIFPAITASTGIAATHIGGRTLHSFIGIGVVDYLDQDVIEQIMQREKLYKKLVDTKVLIIDEISMLDAKVLDKVNVILKAVKKSEKAFGGIQMIFVGDFFQLPPVTKRGEATKYFAFMSSAWKEARPLTCYLEEQFRQTDETFTKLLMAIRENNIDEFHVEILEDLKKKTFEKFGWELPKEKNEGEWEEETVEIDSPSPTLPDREGEVQDYRTGDARNYDNLKMKAKEMRKDSTLAEDFLWENLRNDKLGSKFRRQHVIDNYIVDFVNLTNKLIVEVDGEIHDFQIEKDIERSNIFKNLGFKVIRFKNEDILNNVESVIGKIIHEITPSLSGRVGEGPTHDILELHSHNKNVDEINEGKLNSLSGKVFTYNMFTQGRASLVENLIKSCLSPETLKLKVGAKVIFTKNDMEGKYVNGTMGIVQDLDKDGIVIETTNGKIIDAKQEEWKYEDEGKVKAKIMQYPLRLAWAITVHKSQGMSLDEAIINLGETFEFGQGYVALSRLRSLEGLFLKSYNPKSLQVNSIISEFDEKIRKDSRFIQDKFKKSQKEEKEKIENLQKTFVEKCGGIWEGGVKGEVQNGVDKKPTVEVTLDLIKEGKSLGEIADSRDIKQESISKHVEELFEKEKLNKNDLEKIQPVGVKVFNIPNDVKKSFKKNKLKVDEEGKIKLSTVFHDLKEKYTYEQLRWYRMVID